MSTPSLDDYCDALEALALLQSHSKNPITRAWAVKHSAEARWLRTEYDRVDLPVQIEQLQSSTTTTTEGAFVAHIDARGVTTLDLPPTEQLVPQRAAPLVSAHVVEVTDTEVVVRVTATATGWQRLHVRLDVDTDHVFDLAQHGPVVQGEHRYLRPEVSHEQTITVTAMSEGGDSASATTKVWLPQLDEVPPEG